MKQRPSAILVLVVSSAFAYAALDRILDHREATRPAHVCTPTTGAAPVPVTQPVTTRLVICAGDGTGTAQGSHTVIGSGSPHDGTWGAASGQLLIGQPHRMFFGKGATGGGPNPTFTLGPVSTRGTHTGELVVGEAALAVGRDSIAIGRGH